MAHVTTTVQESVSDLPNRLPWRWAHDLVEDASRWDDPAFDLWYWICAELDWTPGEVQRDVEVRRAVRRVQFREPGLGALMASVFEIREDSPIIAALIQGGCKAVYDMAGCTWMEARAHELSLFNLSYDDIADVLGCKQSTAETHVRRAQEKLARLAA
jgi:DNA-binding CsgD family transcriptional regulator